MGDSFHDGVVYRSLDEPAVRRECLNRCRIIARKSVLEPGQVDEKGYEACRAACEREYGRPKKYTMKAASLKKCKELAQDDDDVFAACCRDNNLRYRPVDDRHPVVTPPPISEHKPYKKYSEIRDKTWYPDSLLYSCFDSVNGQCLHNVSKDQCRRIIENNPLTSFGQHLQTEHGGVCIPFMLSNARWYANNRTPIENLVPSKDIALGGRYESTVFYDPASFESFLTGNFYLRADDSYVAADDTTVIDKAAAELFFVHNDNGHNIINLKNRHTYLLTMRRSNNTLLYDREKNVLVLMPIVNQKNSRVFSYDENRFFPYMTMDPTTGDRVILAFWDTRRVPYGRLGYLRLTDQKLVFSKTQKTPFRLERAPVEPVDTVAKNRLVDIYYKDFLAQLRPTKRPRAWPWIVGAVAVALVVVVAALIFFFFYR
ncbi:hypothetical protein EBZ80_02500 [bacterium]|nr:hypothetical protein [bacterium]